MKMRYSKEPKYRKFVKAYGFLSFERKFEERSGKKLMDPATKTGIDAANIVKKYNNTVHKTIKMKPIDVTSGFHAEYNEDSNEKDPKCKVDDHVRISKYKNIFAKGYTQNWSEVVFVITIIKNTIPWTHATSDSKDEEIDGTFYEQELQKTNQKEFRMEKIIKRNGDKLFVKWKEYDSYFNSWIDKRDIV